MLYNYWKLKWEKYLLNFLLILKSVINYIWKKKKKIWFSSEHHCYFEVLHKDCS